MRPEKLAVLTVVSFSAFTAARAQQSDGCAGLTHLPLTGVEITKAEEVVAGKIIPPAYPGSRSVGPLPAHCLVDGMIHRRKGVDGQEFGTGFAIALPDQQVWNATS